MIKDRKATFGLLLVNLYDMRRTAPLILTLTMLLCACSPAARLSEQMVRSQMFRCPDATYLDFLEGKLKWNYTPGLELRSYLDVHKAYGSEDIFSYAEAWYDAIVQEDGSILTYKVDRYSTDHICPAKTLFYLYDRTGKEKYRKAMDLVKSQIDGHPRTSDGAFWHKKDYPWQIWLDGVYMAEPFYVEYVSRYFPEEDKAAAYDDIVNEFVRAREHCYDPATGLMRHAWDETHSQPWADPESGRSAHCWGRALGWYCMALLDVLDFLPEGYEGRGTLIDILKDICAVLPQYTDVPGGAWYQVLDQPGREGNYIESTCTAMFCYTYLKGIRMGYLDGSLLPYAKGIYEYMLSKFIVRDDEGRISITQCCSVGGLGGKQNRMGDFAYYLSEPIRDNDPKGVGPFIWASLEYEKL